jgi:hypothetical protein
MLETSKIAVVVVGWVCGDDSGWARSACSAGGEGRLLAKRFKE